VLGAWESGALDGAFLLRLHIEYDPGLRPTVDAVQSSFRFLG